MAWPRDGRRETLEGAGVALAQQYTAQGPNMIFQHAQFADGSVSVEAGLMDILTRMETGKFKVFRGGGWNQEVQYARSGNHFMMAPSNGIHFVGFRMALAPTLPQSGQ